MPKAAKSKTPKVARVPMLSEANIQNTCTNWLQLDGWRHIVTDPPRLRGMGVTEPGIADRLFLRYRGKPCGEHAQAIALRLICGPQYAEVLWVEFKRGDGKPSEKQIKWHAKEQSSGALTWIATVDFPPTIEGFQSYYRESGLMRRKI